MEDTEMAPIMSGVEVVRLDFSGEKLSPEILEKIDKIDSSPLANRHLIFAKDEEVEDEDKEEDGGPLSLAQILADGDTTSFGVFKHKELVTVVYFYPPEDEDYDSTHELSFFMTEETQPEVLIEGISKSLENLRKVAENAEARVVFYQTNNYEETVGYAHGDTIEDSQFAQEVEIETKVLTSVGFKHVEDIEDGNVRTYISG